MKKHRVNKLEESVIKTLSYADVFDFPMKPSEIWKFLIGAKIQENEFYRKLKKILKKGLIRRRGKYLFLHGRAVLYSLRIQRKKESIKKLKMAKRVSGLLALIPSVRLIGISGSLSMNNSNPEDDIDLFIVSAKNTMWLTRFCVNLVLLLLSRKRKREEILAQDQICPNMFLAQDHLVIPVGKQNIFSAHEVVQLRVLVNKKKTHERFLAENKWVLKFLPNSFEPQPISSGFCFMNQLAIPMDRIFFLAQFFYMKNRITTEEIGRSFARFHPKDKSNFIRQIYRLRYETYLNFARKLSRRSISKTGSFASINTPGY
ncbi:MAG: hypothetical protein A3C27_00930 [Candidatus Levybacteria bacterium RIFCSPHIGHO2_02_FULL_39_36]|nr:MAG: hypothetical protein UT20_C0052G0003 [Candidatus Levybacteria bacterium GW2011_GWA1_39_11]KKR49405.1 MAG: hypothetical protein UT85_C0021G0013 [Candidatus Levybacteria bacterium GW2011_GWA2_40_16]OGH14389.1 MAG: hypothetical protein A2689_01555 [Candidatus Levybacteria bacterium RIFCSPHIGHO2_01_FULL_38_96]OGH25562.1 MAG: hypothetical protein A3E68_00675 [Candidatus Levybacteria bacterium RIFCSPHIGHO2_12_FULL_39_39]OGH27529.1 MAG: hypothetical protein A3C27_00930 [Candidatus Levybacteria